MESHIMVSFLAFIVLGVLVAGFVLVAALLGKRGAAASLGVLAVLGLVLLMFVRATRSLAFHPGPEIFTRGPAQFHPPGIHLQDHVSMWPMNAYLVIVVLPLAGFAVAMALRGKNGPAVLTKGMVTLGLVLVVGVGVYFSSQLMVSSNFRPVIRPVRPQPDEVVLHDHEHFAPPIHIPAAAPAPRPPINLEGNSEDEQVARAEIPVNEAPASADVVAPLEQPLQVSNHRFLSDGKQQSEDVHSIPAWVSEDLNLRPHNPNQLDLVISSGRYSTKPEAYAELLQLLDRAIRTYYGNQDERLSHVNFPLEQSRLQGSTIMQEAVVAWPFTTKGEQYRMYQIHWQVQLDGGLKQQLVAIANDTTVLQRLKVLGSAAGGLTLLFAGAAWATRKRQAA